MRYTLASRLVVGVAVLTLSAAQVYAQQPAIADINGSTVQGSLLTITGTNLNAESGQNWDGFFVNHPNAWSFEGSSPASDGYSAIGPKGTFYDTNVKLLGNQSAQFHLSGASSNCPVGNKEDYDAFYLNTKRNDIWVRAYVRWRLNGGAWPAGHIKMLVTTGGFYVQPHSGTTLPTTFVGVVDGVTMHGNIPSGQLQNDRWYLVEAHIKNSSPTNFTVWIDGTQILTRTPNTGPLIDTILFGFVNLCSTNSAFDLYHWFDGLAIGSSRIYGSAIVEVGNSPNYSTATKKVQALEKIADDQVVFRLDTSGLGSGPYYVWVTNNRRLTTPAFFLTGGQISGPTAPANLRIIP